MNGTVRFFGALRPDRCFSWSLVVVLSLMASTANAFNTDGYLRVAPKAGGKPSWIRTARITRVGGVPTVWTAGGRAAPAALNLTTMRNVCKVRQACVAAFGVAAVASAIAYYRWQAGTQPDLNKALGYPECLPKSELVDRYMRQTINIPCGSGTPASYLLQLGYSGGTKHGQTNSYGETVSHASVAWRSRKSSYKYPHLADPFTRYAGNQNSTRFINRTGGQTVAEYVADPVNTIDVSQWFDAAEVSNGVVLQTATATDGKPVYGTITITDTATLTDADYLTETETTRLGLTDTVTGTAPATDAPTTPGTGTQPGAGTAGGGVAGTCGRAPLPPCDVTVKNWPEAPSSPDYLVPDDQGLTERVVTVGRFDYGTGWLPRSCPAPVSIQTPYGTVSFSYQWICQLLELVAPLTILGALLAGLRIVFRSGEQAA